jgi:F-type H+-transporting ATPase subunit delta
VAESRASSRYIKSLLGLAVEKGVLEEVNQDMALFARVCDENRAFLLMLKNPIIKHDKKKRILEKLFSGKVSSLTMAIFDIITRKNREPLLPEITHGFHQAYNEFKGIRDASVTTAVPLDAALRAQFDGMVKKVSGKTRVEMHEKVDPDIIGGFILNVGDQRIDASIKNKIHILKMELGQSLRQRNPE